MLNILYLKHKYNRTINIPYLNYIFNNEGVIEVRWSRR